MENKSSLATKASRRTSPFRYGIGMFGTSIPINMFKSFYKRLVVNFSTKFG